MDNRNMFQPLLGSGNKHFNIIQIFKCIMKNSAKIILIMMSFLKKLSLVCIRGEDSTVPKFDRKRRRPGSRECVEINFIEEEMSISIWVKEKVTIKPRPALEV